jgi:hypothetical protein
VSSLEPICTDRLLLRPFDVGDAPVVQRELSRVEMARVLAIPHPYPEDGDGSGEGAFESCAVGRLAVRRQHDLHGLVEQRPQPVSDLLDRDAFR